MMIFLCCVGIIAVSIAVLVMCALIRSGQISEMEDSNRLPKIKQRRE